MLLKIWTYLKLISNGVAGMCKNIDCCLNFEKQETPQLNVILCDFFIFLFFLFVGSVETLAIPTFSCRGLEGGLTLHRLIMNRTELHHMSAVHPINSSGITAVCVFFSQERSSLTRPSNKVLCVTFCPLFTYCWCESTWSLRSRVSLRLAAALL